MARRVARLSTTFRRSVIELGLQPGSPGFRAVSRRSPPLLTPPSYPVQATMRRGLGLAARSFVVWADAMCGSFTAWSLRISRSEALCPPA